MSLIKRLVKGSPLTFQEGDDNLQYLENLSLSSSADFNNWTGSSLSQFAGTSSFATTASYALNAESGLSGGTQYYLPVWTGASTLGTSSLYESGSVLKTIYNAGDIGLKLDFANTTYQLGQLTGNNQTYLQIYDDGTSATIRGIYQNNPNGINLDYTGRQATFGFTDINETNISLNDNIKVISFRDLGNINGLNIDFNNQLYQIGQINGNGALFEIDEINGIIKTKITGNDIGLKLDFANSVYNLGQLVSGNTTSLELNDTAQTLTTYNSSSARGLYFDYTTGQYYLGESTINNQTNLLVDDGASIIKTIYQNNDIGLKLDFANSRYELGQLTGGNQTKLTIDDPTNTISITGSLVAPSITGSLQGTSSWAVSASWAPSSILSTTFISTGSVSASVNITTSSFFQVQSGSSNLLIVRNPPLAYSWTGIEWGTSANGLSLTAGSGPLRIGTLSGNGILFTTNITDRWILDGTGIFYPSTNNLYDIGTSTNRVRNIYTTGLYLLGSFNHITSASTQTQVNSIVTQFDSNGGTSGYAGGYDFRVGSNGTATTSSFRIWKGGARNLSRIGIGDGLTETIMNNATNTHVLINSNVSGSTRNAGLRISAYNTPIEYNGIQFDMGTLTQTPNSEGGAFIGVQYNTAVNGYGSDLVILATSESANSYGEIARFVGKSRSVSIGSSPSKNPIATLDVSGSGRFTDGLTVSGSGNIFTVASSSANLLTVSSSGMVTVATSGSANTMRLYMAGGSYPVIETLSGFEILLRTNNQDRLKVSDNITANVPIRLGTSSGNPIATIRSSGSFVTDILLIAGLSGSVRGNVYVQSGSLIAQGGGFSVTTGSTSYINVFPSNGNVFIGSTPVDGGFKLDVNGTARIQDTLTLSNNKYLQFIYSVGSNGFAIKQDTSNRLVIDNGNYGYNVLSIKDTSAALSSTGLVGIFTQNPVTTLDVSGSGRFTDGLTITGSATITNVLTLPYQDPLPSSPATGSIALSGSGATFVGMFVWTGVWTQI